MKLLTDNIILYLPGKCRGVVCGGGDEVKLIAWMLWRIIAVFGPNWSAIFIVCGISGFDTVNGFALFFVLPIMRETKFKMVLKWMEIKMKIYFIYFLNKFSHSFKCAVLSRWTVDPYNSIYRVWNCSHYGLRSSHGKCCLCCWVNTAKSAIDSPLEFLSVCLSACRFSECRLACLPFRP